jgi:hypothetical protein
MEAIDRQASDTETEATKRKYFTVVIILYAILL